MSKATGRVATLTSKSQITIPVEVRRRLALDTMCFILHFERW